MNDKNLTKEHFWFYINYYKSQKKNIVFSLLLSIIQTFSLIPIAIIIQYIFANSLPEKNGKELLLLLSFIFGLFIINSIVILLNRHVTLTTIKSIIYLIRKDLLENTMFLTRQFYSNDDLDKTHSEIVQDTERMDCMISALLSQFIPGILTVTGLLCLIIYLNPFLFLIVFSIMPLLFIMGKILAKRVKELIHRFHSDFSNFSKGVLFVLKFNEAIKLSTAEKIELEKQNKYIENLRFSSHKMAWLATAYNITQSNLLTLSGVIVLLVGGFQVINNTITVSELLSFYVALGLLSTNLKIVISTIPTILEGKESIITLRPLLTQRKIIKDSSILLDGFDDLIKFENVYFSYNKNFSLNNISFTINKNEVIGILGVSGSGKSTIINLLLGFYQPQKGKITIDNYNLNDIDLIHYRKNIGVLLQDSLIFPGSIRENLVYGLSNVDDKDMIEICKLCNIDHYITSLEKGYDSDIGERGIKISGGQKQRIAIARALLRKPQLLILDEPENNLDEELIFEIIKNIKALEITLFLITHNIKMKKYIDRLYEFENQILVEKKDRILLKNEIT